MKQHPRRWYGLIGFLSIALMLMAVSVAPVSAAKRGNNPGVGPLEKSEPLVGKDCFERPLSDFLNAQGSSSSFFPPVKDYVGWADAVDPDTELPTTFALVDYAGLANEYIKAQTGHSLGTRVRGRVVQCNLDGNKAQITVTLSTTKAMGFAQSIEDLVASGFDFDATPTIFGAKAIDVANGADAAVGSATLRTTFSITKDDDDNASLPDFLDVVNNAGNYLPVELSFRSTTPGKCSNGRRAVLHVCQVASTKDGVLVYSNERVDFSPSGACD